MRRRPTGIRALATPPKPPTDVYVGGHDTIDWNSGALYRIPRNGGPLDTVNQGHSVFGIAVDVARVYWTRGGAGEVWMRCKGE